MTENRITEEELNSILQKYDKIICNKNMMDIISIKQSNPGLIRAMVM